MKMKRLSGFSLMEMMIVLLIVSIVAAASAPMINRRMVSEAADGCEWEWNNELSALYFDRENIAVAIGTIESGRVDNNPDTTPLLHIESDGNPHIRLTNEKGAANIVYGTNTVCFGTGTIDFANTNNSVLIGGDFRKKLAYGSAPQDAIPNVGSNSISIGAGAGNNTNTSLNSIAIGSLASGASNSIAIGAYGFMAKYPDQEVSEGVYATSNSIAIGRHARITTSSNSIAIGNNVAIWEENGYSENKIGNDAIVIGNNVSINKRGGSAIAIGNNTNVYGTDTIGIGKNLKVGANQAIVIGRDITNHAGNDRNSQGLLGKLSTAERAILIGAGIKPSRGDGHGIAIGYQGMVGQNSISIGYQAQTAYDAKDASDDVVDPSYNAIAIGYKSIANSENSIAIGPEAQVPKNVYNDVWDSWDGEYGKSENPTLIPNSIAIGSEAKVYAKNSIAIGAGAEVPKNYISGTATHSGQSPHNLYSMIENSVAIGAGAKATASNQIVLGTADTTVYIPGKLIVDQKSILANKSGNVVVRGKSGQGQASIFFANTAGSDVDIKGSYVNSDRRLKNVGEAFKAGLAEIKKLELFHYTYKKDSKKTPHVGVMAQDLMKIFPDAVWKGEDGFYRIRMEDMFYALVNAVKELDAKIDAILNNEIAELRKENQEQQKLIEKLEKQNAKLEKRLDALERGK